MADLLITLISVDNSYVTLPIIRETKLFFLELTKISDFARDFAVQFDFEICPDNSLKKTTYRDLHLA